MEIEIRIKPENETEKDLLKKLDVALEKARVTVKVGDKLTTSLQSLNSFLNQLSGKNWCGESGLLVMTWIFHSRVALIQI